MIVLERKQAPGHHGRHQCGVPTCIRSARWDFILLDGHHTFLCSQHKEEWGDIYAKALTNWADEAREAA